MNRLLPLVCVLSLGAGHALAGTVFSVKLDAAVRKEPASGRLLVFLVKDGSKVERQAPIDAPFWDDPQPMFGADVKNLAPGASAKVDDSATSFPEVASKLPAGTYRAAARLDINRTNSNWRRDADNLFSSKVVTFTVDPAKPDQIVEITLDQATAPRAPTGAPGVEFVEVKSKLLSAFHKRDVMLRAGLALPAEYDPAKKYAAVYEVPGFGGDHSGAAPKASRLQRAADTSPEGQLARNVFWIWLDPESANGHTLFANSANNGPCGDALVKELIPAIEAKFPLVARPQARILRGHSSGGWSTLWLALNYPETFGACWSSSPDPVDFRRFQLPDIYGGPSMYFSLTTGGKTELPSIRGPGGPGMTIRQENLMEEVLGPKNTSAQQWDSWLAVWGARDLEGHPAALYDPVTGALDKKIAEQYRAYDLTELLKKNQGTMGLIWKQRIRLVVGDQDTFYLNEAVALLKPEVEKLSFFHYPEGGHGYIKIVEGYDHGSVYGSPELRGFAGEMVEHLRRQGLAPKAD
jgi:S-formylglutathione hydrolase FrmB